ncbi:hypothetical protein BJY00DRAFT_307656 [Aspergillus carlsbadensis]|nr:hypothetical protein BJY00DRAFT_307656 [Aspergillus carlsbadensis]
MLKKLDLGKKVHNGASQLTNLQREGSSTAVLSLWDEYSPTTPSTTQESPDTEHPNWDWEKYIKYRPAYPDSLFDALYTYHAAASPDNTFTVAHDVGAGPGNVSARLAERFTRVVLSDPNKDFLSAARGRLSSSSCSKKSAMSASETPTSTPDITQGQAQADKFIYLAESAERSSAASGAVDLVIIADALHWTDIPASIAEFARQLKSGGTLCVPQYGPAWIENNEEAQRAWEGLFYQAVRDLFFGDGDRDARNRQSGKPEDQHGSLCLSSGNEGYILAGRRFATGLDNVGFPWSQWRDGVVRTFTNTRGDPKKPGIAVSEAGLGEEEDAVGATDERSFIEGDPEWMVQGCDLAWLQGVFGSFFGGRSVEDDLERWKELERALGGGTVTVVWPSVRILTTRR